ncbi:hypothetical protein AKO1_014611 [Acrasis kona]|uniref:Poly [ADP-ribose] polymerase n=1 Tax=Acrasis kona TaxID=1008807 RepID=A0AAW2Z2T3_9EUKA
MGLAHFMMDMDIHVVDAVRDAVETNNQKLIMTLLNKAPTNDLLCLQDKTKNTLIHIICDHASNGFQDYKKVIKKLIKSGVNLNAKNEKGLLAIHLAVKNRNYELASVLVKCKIDLNAIVPSKGCTLLHDACRNNDIRLVQLLSYADPNVLDSQKRNCLHVALHPNEFGSYQNVNLVKELLDRKVDANAKDRSGRTPSQYAYLLQDADEILKILKLNKSKSPIKLPSNQKTSFVPVASQQIKNHHIDLKKDAQEMIIKLESQLAESKSSSDRDDEKKVKIDSKANMPKSTIIHEPYNVLLQKTEILYGTTGCNNFYKMQILHNPVQDNLYVLWNAWGRVGSHDYQYQRTPYNNLEECITEFKKIFKSKTKNDFKDLDNFQRHDNKYNLIKLTTKKSAHDLLQPINASKCAPIKYLDDAVKSLMIAFTDVKAMKANMIQSGLDTGHMQLGRLTKETLQQGLEILKRIQNCLNEMENNHLNADYTPAQGREDITKIGDLSDEFYNLIPHGEFSNSAVALISTSEIVKTKIKILEDLIDMQVAARIVMASQNQQETLNPLDYCYLGLNTTIVTVNKSDADFKILKKYILQTSGGGMSDGSILNIFRVNRHEENDRFEPFKKDSNRKLLWHGSSTTNYLSILSSGLRIAPPEAPSSGFMFGKGIYFADMFAKSKGYCRFGNSHGSRIVVAARWRWVSPSCVGTHNMLVSCQRMDSIPPKLMDVPIQS